VISDRDQLTVENTVSVTAQIVSNQLCFEGD